MCVWLRIISITSCVPCDIYTRVVRNLKRFSKISGMRLVIRAIASTNALLRCRACVIILILLNTRCPPRHYTAAIVFFIVSLLLLLSLLLRGKCIVRSQIARMSRNRRRSEKLRLYTTFLLRHYIFSKINLSPDTVCNE